jgi:hypothetical protein
LVSALDTIETLDVSNLPHPLSLSYDSLTRVTDLIGVMQVYITETIARRESLLKEITNIQDDLEITDRPVLDETSDLDTILEDLRVLWTAKMKTRVDEVCSPS